MKTRKIHYGWAVTAGCGLMLVYALGFPISCFSVFLAPLKETLALSGTQTSSLMSIINVGGLITIAAASFLYERFGIRIITFACGISITIGYLLYAFSHSLIMCYLGSVLIGFGFGAGSLLPVSLLMVTWFDKRRGFALGIATSCTGITTIIYPPLLTYFIDHISLSSAFILEAVSAFIFATISFLLVRNKPEDIGLKPYGYDAEKTESQKKNLDEYSDQTDEKPEGVSFKEALRSKELKMLVAGIILVSIVIQPIISHIAIFYNEEGYSSVTAAFMVSLYGFMMIFGKPLFGFLIDKLGITRANIYIFAVMLLSVVCGILLKQPFLGYSFAVLLALGQACYTTVGLPLFVEYIFGKLDMPKILSGVKIVGTCTGAFCLNLPGVIYDVTGTYHAVFLIYGACLILAFVIMQKLFVSKSRRR